MVADPFQEHRPALSSPARQAFAIAPSATDDLPMITQAIYVGTGGDIALVTKDGDAVTFKAVPQGSVLPVRARAVRAAGTTAADLVGLV